MIRVRDGIYSAAADDNDLGGPGVVVIDLRDLNDGPNDPQLCARKLVAGWVAHVQQQAVCFRCQAGVSRSNAHVAGFLALLGADFDAALAEVKAAVARANPNDGILASVRMAVTLIQSGSIGK